MKFKHPLLALQFDVATEPELRDFALELKAESRRRMWPELVVTCTGRTPEENKKENGVANSLHLWEPDVIPTKPKFTRALDFSHRPYPTDDLVSEVERWIRQELSRRGFIHRKKPDAEKHERADGRWEFLNHDVGSGPHFHVGIRRPQEKKP